jgi:hypothetical protein
MSSLDVDGQPVNGVFDMHVSPVTSPTPNPSSWWSQAPLGRQGEGNRAASDAMADADNERLDKLIEASAAALGLPIESAWKPAIKGNLEVTLRLANMVAEFELPDEAEPAPTFEA